MGEPENEHASDRVFGASSLQIRSQLVPKPRKVQYAKRALVLVSESTLEHHSLRRKCVRFGIQNLRTYI